MDEIEELTQEVLSFFQGCNSAEEITPDAVFQINKMHGKPVSAKRVETTKVEAAPRTVICSGWIRGEITKKGGVERIQVLVQSVGGVKLTPPQTKYFQRKNDYYPWADKDGNVFKSEQQLREEADRARALSAGLDNPTTRAERVTRAREELMRVAGVR